MDPVRTLTAVGALLLFLAYWTIFALTTDDGVTRGALQALNNTVPAIILAWLTHLVLERHVWSTRPALRLALQIPLALVFALGWYLAILVIRELRGDWLTDGFRIEPFAPVAFIWQMFQGITFYALVAVSSLAIVLSKRLTAVEAGTANERPNAVQTPATLLVRTPDGSEAVPLDDISRISGAGDYSEISLPGRSILSTTTLAEFEKRLPQDRFLRAHRSHILRLGAVVRSEPAGNGRTAIHLVDGSDIVTSRAGTRLLREASL